HQYSPLRDAVLTITDHPDDPSESLGFLRTLYSGLSALGFTSVRYDWRWNKVEPVRGRIVEAQLDHYRQVKRIMDQVGLQAPTVILSTPPRWAMQLYKAGQRQAFIAAYRNYAERVVAALQQAGGRPIRIVQIL